MKAFLWYNIDVASLSWHTEGSVLVEAETLSRAREIAVIMDGKKAVKMSVDGEPDAVFESSSKEEKIWVFPDAGCC